MKWISPILLLSLLISCATNIQTDYVKPSLSEYTVEDIEQYLVDGKPDLALQYMQALENAGIWIPPNAKKSLYYRAAEDLRAQFEEALEINDYSLALKKARSLVSIGELSSSEADEVGILLAQARQYVAGDRPTVGLALLQNILRLHRVSTTDLLLFADTAVRERNITVARHIQAELEKRGETSPDNLIRLLSRQSDFGEMIKGTATVWVNRGITMEAGVGYPDRSIGSGFFIDTRGFLLTNYHVIFSEVDPEYEGFSRLYIKMSTDPETKIPAKVVGYDRILDIALLKVEVEPEYIFSLSDEKDFRPGEQLFAMGSPIGLENTITSGIVSATGRRFLQIGEAIQVDVPVNQGNSGGPLIDKNGRLVGVIFAGIEQYEGINFAIPSDWVHIILPKLYAGGEVNHPWLGAAVKETGEGLEIMYVLPGEPADVAGLKQGDLIVSLNGKPYDTLLEIQREIIRNSPETLVRLRWKRKEKQFEGLFFLNERPFRPMDLALNRDTRDNLIAPLFGMALQETDKVYWRSNYVIEKIYKGTIADETGLSRDDPVSIQRWQVDEEFRVAILNLFVMKKTAGFLEKAVQLAAYLEIDNFI